MSTVADTLAVTRSQVGTELQRADTKATTLLSLVAAAFAGIIALTGRHLPVAAEIALWCSGAPILAAVLLLLAAIRPRLHDPAPQTWLWAAEHGPARLVAAPRHDRHHRDRDRPRPVLGGRDRA
ncbi:hypothetical protein ACFQV2_00310 [Actinokineospora soli]|uniref:Pycsar effector protein domain-containing protein n=1 Tax=Actinokineospora soli TaxID=1048753 RepID=A0ABW2TFS5_9PSEU